MKCHSIITLTQSFKGKVCRLEVFFVESSCNETKSPISDVKPRELRNYLAGTVAENSAKVAFFLVNLW